MSAIKITLLLLLALVALPARAQENQERLAVSNGHGVLAIGEQKFKITSVVVKLIDERKAEITLVSDISIFLIATCSSRGESRREYDLQIEGTESRVGLDGIGRVIFSADGKSVARLSLKGVSRTTKRPVEANFEGK